MRITDGIVIALTVAILGGCASSSSIVVELPRPNSGTFTFAQAAAKKSDIYSLVPSGMKSNWKNPYMGSNVHITKSDEIVVYDGTWAPIIPDGTMNLHQFKETLASYSAWLLGNPLGVLITCERDPRSSATFPQVLDLLFNPWVQIFYQRHP